MSLNIRALALFAAFSLPLAACAAPIEQDATEAGETSAEVVSRSAYFETFQGLDGQFYFHLMAGNGQNVLRSEGYTTEAAALDGIASVMDNGVSASQYDIKQAASGQWFFSLRAGNNHVIGSSQMYATKSSAQRGTRTVASLLKLGSGEVVTPAPKVERIEIFVGEDRQTYFRLRSGNGEIMLGSQGYSSKSAATKGIASVKHNGADAESYKSFEAANGEWGVRLVAGNGEIIATTELYASKSNANRAIARMVEIFGTDVVVTE